ncbi:hypothetical protein EX30DRAFT_397672 [Ascodesmis nigricans]|uniref:Uncharacterized protein n=1 Tax=Ascodesmis nigricans TaxID=341454 RepID=A0A4S2MNG5_9PEZI|nr:hypothetical protein EX30DRAFT_397672 [Ascodesmis nigricans]
MTNISGLRFTNLLAEREALNDDITTQNHNVLRAFTVDLLVVFLEHFESEADVAEMHSMIPWHYTETILELAEFVKLKQIEGYGLGKAQLALLRNLPEIIGPRGQLSPPPPNWYIDFETFAQLLMLYRDESESMRTFYHTIRPIFRFVAEREVETFARLVTVDRCWVPVVRW